MPTKKCKLCGSEFEARSSRQIYCGKEIQTTCAVCGKSMTVTCNGPVKRFTCSPRCAAAYISLKRKQSASQTTKICAWCGEEFTPVSVRDRYCQRTHFQQCCICGRMFEMDVRTNKATRTCSSECKKQLQLQNRDIEKEQEHHKQTLLDRYGVTNSMYAPEAAARMKATCRDRYGADSYSATEEYKVQVKETCLAKYGVEHHLKAKSVIEKRKETCQSKYGSDSVFSSDFGKLRRQQAMMERYGVVNPSQYPEFKSKATRSARTSSLESRICSLLSNYNIEYVQHYMLTSESCSHEFDFYLPKYKLLIDADGLYFHSYLDDPDGGRVNDYYDDIRVSLVPKDHMFFVIVESTEEQEIQQLVKLLKQIDNNVFNYDSYLFDWCRSIEFPYPQHTPERMQKDWKHLCSYISETYKPAARLGESLIQHFHRSIYSAHVGNYPSPIEAWYDDNLLKKVIENRLIYVNNVDPSKILRGFNVSKICPRVSIFNPVLARYLTLKYLSEYQTVFDPFAGFSGRMLGVCSTGRDYIGHDLNETAVNESNQLMDLIPELQEHAKITVADVLQSTGQYECLLTCPPYSSKETYSSETVVHTCDEWIHECLNRFSCNRYVFVVDNTVDFADYVVEPLRATSHFCTVREQVVVIDR